MLETIEYKERKAIPGWVEYKKGKYIYHELALSEFIITIHRHIYYPDGTWLATCYPALFKNKPLKSKEPDKAKLEAEFLLKNILKKTLNEFKPF